MEQSDFVAWVESEIKQQGWSLSEFARRGGISNQLVSQVLNHQSDPGEKFLGAVAKAFKLDAAVVYQKAGRFEGPGQLHPGLITLNRRIMALSNEEQREKAIQAFKQMMDAIEAAARLTLVG